MTWAKPGIACSVGTLLQDRRSTFAKPFVQGHPPRRHGRVSSLSNPIGIWSQSCQNPRQVQRNFERRKVSLGSCGRSFGTACIHEHACIRCPLLRPDPAQRTRLIEIRENLHARIAEARREGWAGEVEGLQISLSGTRQKLAMVDEISRGRSPASTFSDVAGRSVSTLEEEEAPHDSR
jgi:hypothetical protein